MLYDQEEVLYSYKNWDLIQKEDTEALWDLRKELEEKGLEGEELEEEMREGAWGQEIVILEWEENGELKEGTCSYEEAVQEYENDKY